MRRGRRRGSVRGSRESGDSLELLLDVICNLFGAIIFIALLTALLVRAGGRPEPAAGESTRTPDEVIVLRAEVDALRGRLGSPEMRERLAAMGPLAEAARRVDDARDELERRSAIAAEYERRIGELTDDSTDPEASRAELELQVARLIEEKEALRSLTERTLRTPRRRGVARTWPAQIVVADGRAYVVNDWAGGAGGAMGDPCARYCRWNDDAVDLAAGPECIVHDCWADGSLFIERSIPLRADGGVPLRTPAMLADDPRWLRAIDGLDPRLHVISLRVAPDSFGAFAIVREDLARRGFAYDVNPTLLDPRYQDTIIQGTPTAQ